MKKNLIAVLLGSQCLLSGGFAIDFDVQKIQIKISVKIIVNLI